MDEQAPDLAAIAAAAPERAAAILTDPKDFFSRMPREGGYEEPGTFAAVMLLAYGAILALLALFGIGVHGFFAALIIVPILGSIGLLIGTAITLFVSRALGGEATFESSFRIVAYASAISPVAAVATVVPYLPILVNAYAFYVFIVAVIAVHRVPEDKAWRILGGIAAVLLLLSLFGAIAGRRAERAAEEWAPEIEKWGAEMEKNAQEMEKATADWQKKMESATEEMRKSLERQQGKRVNGKRLEGRIALVTGGSRGIGRGIALEMAREGADVVVNYRKDADAAEETAAEIRGRGRRAIVAQADVGDYEAVTRMVAEAEKGLGPIDLVVANSGVASRPAPLATLPLEEWHRVINVDLNGVFYTLRATVPGLLERKRGTVLIVSSVGADLCAPYGAPYYAAKAGVNALMKVLARELAPVKIRVNCIAPGLISSDMGERMLKALGEPLLAGIPLARPGTPEEVGKLAVFLASEDAAFITGKIYRIDGGAFM